MKRKLLLLSVLLILLGQSTHALSFATYRLDWFNRLSGSGGAVTSAGYQVQFTVGQTARGVSTSPLYQVHLGYWAGAVGEMQPSSFHIYLPEIMSAAAAD